MKLVYVIKSKGKDYHGECNCGLCNSNGHSYEASIYEIKFDKNFDPNTSFSELLLNEDYDFLENAEKKESVYAPSQEAAEHNAKEICEKNYGKVSAVL